MDPVAGLYEILVTEDLQERLHALADRLPARQRPLEPADAPDRIAWHLAQRIEAVLGDLPDSDRVAVGIALAHSVLDVVEATTSSDRRDRPVVPGLVLHGLWPRRPDGSERAVAEPLTPLLDTTLLTNAPGEPGLWSQLRSEIASADRIDVVMAFIRRSGIAPLLDELARHTGEGRPLRVLTTTYTGSTERAALDRLAALGADVRVSYDLGTTRLHAKAWLFHRRSGFSTAYVGSSNLTQTAQVTGLEWNVRLAQARNPHVLAKVAAVFDAYWSSGDFVGYDADQFDEELRRVSAAAEGTRLVLSPVEVHPLPFQERLLELLEVARSQGHHRNLLVAATGTGKTVMAALDYAGLRTRLRRSRLLFVAHRQEILDQSLATFRSALRDPSFGETWAGGMRPQRFDHVFASVQSLNAAGVDTIPPDHFDVVIIDEFHHAAAASYRQVLDHLQPVELLGLTATPERSDGLPILDWFGGRIAAELRLWDAIDQQLLAPFLYFGIHDGVDLRDIPWRRGQGYDIEALSNLYTSSDAWARLVVKQLADRVDVGDMRCLGFCVSVAHAQFMAHHFRRAGITAVAVSANTPRDEREQALRDLAAGRVRAVFSVDLFNEGVDVPAADTVLLLRPTESPTLFLQQLGRGLRRAPGKAACTVLDFVGNHRREFRFDRRFRALLGGSRQDAIRAVTSGFPFLPAGCSMQLDAVARDVVLRSLRDAIPTRWPAKVEELRALRRDNPDIDLATFLQESGLDLDDVYDGSRCWSDLQQAAGAPTAPPGPHERTLRRSISRLLHTDDAERLDGFLSLLAEAHPPTVATLHRRRRRLLHLLVAQVADQALGKGVSLQEAAELLWQHPQVLAELSEVFRFLRTGIDHLHEPLHTHPDAPLQVHARYSRIEILAALGIASAGKVPPWQTGVYHAPAQRCDLLAFTLDKSSGGFSPTTRYRDYAISRSLVHWESQSVTRADSETGLRYRHHEQDGWAMLLFARLRSSDRAFWFLGPAHYRGHVGERPMAVTWELEYPLPGDLYTQFAAAVA